MSALSWIHKWGLTSLLLLGLPLLFMEGPLSRDNALDRALWDLGHMLYFALAIVALRDRLDMRTWPHWLAISLAVFVISIMLEYLRYDIGQTQDWTDIERNLVGAWLSIFWLNPSGPQIWTGRVLATGLFAQQVSQVVLAALTLYRLGAQLPDLSNFETDYQASWWQGPVSISDTRAWEGERSLAIDLTPEEYEGARLINLPSDWSRYQRLTMAIYNPKLTPLALTLRIDDRDSLNNNVTFGQRFSESFIVEFGWNLVQIPLRSDAEANPDAPTEPRLNLSDVAELELFAVELKLPRRIHLDQLRLE
ncbi:hypothetical protein N9W78_00945 [bacterium]|nr:hypothetical protein [bacterium]